MKPNRPFKKLAWTVVGSLLVFVNSPSALEPLAVDGPLAISSQPAGAVKVAVTRTFAEIAGRSGASRAFQPQPNRVTVHYYEGPRLAYEATYATTFDSGGNIRSCQFLHALSAYWGPDWSGSLGGAGAVGGLVALSYQEAGQSSPALAFPSYDGNGNLVTLHDAAGTLLAAYEYGPFGRILRAEGSWVARNPFGFSTKWTDPLTGLVDFGLRWYDPVAGRFLSRDPIGEQGGRNLYAFVNNDPVNQQDYLGLAVTMTGFGLSSTWETFAGASAQPDPANVARAEAEIQRMVGVLQAAEDRLRYAKISDRVDELFSTAKFRLNQHAPARAGGGTKQFSNLLMGNRTVAPDVAYWMPRLSRELEALITEADLGDTQLGEDLRAELHRINQKPNTNPNGNLAVAGEIVATTPEVLGTIAFEMTPLSFWRAGVEVGDGHDPLTGERANRGMALASIGLGFVGTTFRAPVRGMRAAKAVGAPNSVDFVKNTGPLGGKLATTRQVNAAQRELSNFGIGFNRSFKGKGGAFDFADASAPFVSVPKRPTQIQLFHEMTHARQYGQLGRGAYIGLGKFNREAHVFNQIWKNRRNFNNAEVRDAIQYMRDIRTLYRRGAID